MNKKENNITSIQYEGKVRIRYKIKDKIVEKNNHNEGTKLLFQSFAKFLTGYFSYNDIPQYIDLRTDELPDNSILKIKPRVTKAYSEIDNKWVAQFSCVIDSKNLIEPTTRKVTGEYYFLSLTNKVDDIYNAFAFMKIEADDINFLLNNPGLAITIDWMLMLENKETTEEND